MVKQPPPIAVLAVDDHPLYLEGIAAVIASAGDVKLVGAASSGQMALERYRALRPDVTLMDLRLPDMSGIEAIQLIRSACPTARVIVLTSSTGDRAAHSALTAGACAYVLKDNAHAELLETIRAVHQGETAIDPAVASAIAEHLFEAPLTARELAVLRLLAEGNTNRDAAKVLGIHEETVKGHVKNVLSKLGARDRTHAVTLALRRGIISL